jgi:thiamine pyrophosphate-dependent acetolactate synthase large subunit-like protein
MRVYEAIGETLKKLEVRATFGLMGDGNLRFMTHLAEELGMPYYAARHEGGAVAMADGYARVTGQVGVCSVTQGPGVTNTLTALTEARKAGTPMLLSRVIPQHGYYGTIKMLTRQPYSNRSALPWRECARLILSLSISAALSIKL